MKQWSRGLLFLKQDRLQQQQTHNPLPSQQHHLSMLMIIHSGPQKIFVWKTRMRKRKSGCPHLRRLLPVHLLLNQRASGFH